jgi:hypothetical protein
MKKNLKGRGLEAGAVRREERPRGRDLEEKDTAIISFKAESHSIFIRAQFVFESYLAAGLH